VKREIIVTRDGSTTIRLPEWDECYHSTHGAIQEAYHVFIKSGLSQFGNEPVSILEIGFGTGLNALITLVESEKANQKIDYTGIEAFPVTFDEALAMNYSSLLGSDENLFRLLHECEWEERVNITSNFSLTKINRKFQDIDFTEKFDLIYFDAFGFPVQPELWTEDIFRIMFRAMKKKGLLVTYAARVIIKKNMESAGFKVGKIPGPPGKREMLLAFKDEGN